ncbi:5'/3'-nucleotidase SurE [Cytophagaceae bacterium ABcell3]|nr:5'/3'-nucleotidase SurE [Cytophagaceae bacterium ABcell3]
MSAKPLILVTNDDGITSKGIRTLIDIAKQHGEVLVVAPDSPQSGMGHAITIGETLRLDPEDIFEGIKAWKCSGTPVDCVKMANHIVLKERTPDLVLSGINHGANSSISVIYSGTMSAAIEAAVEGIPAVGFSLCDYSLSAEFDHCREHIHKIIAQVLKTKIPRGVALNVNIPKKGKKIKGIRVCRQANAKWQEDFDERKDPHGRTYYWMTGSFSSFDKGEDTDEHALAENYISVVPCAFDLTAHHAVTILNEEWDV